MRSRQQLVSVAVVTAAFAAQAGEWREAAPMSETRQYPGLATLPDGRILAVTGHPLGGASIASAEIYDPTTNSWTSTGALNLARNGVQPNGLTVLPNTKILISGSGVNSRSVHEAELYDPETGTWTETGSMSTPRTVHQTVRLDDGRVLVTGGIDWGLEVVHASTEIYNYETGEWTAAAPMSMPRFNHRAVRLHDGRVFVCGGNAGYPVLDTVLDTAEMYDPATNRWALAKPMHQRRYAHGLALLKDGRVFVAGGASAANTPVAAAEVFDPATGMWTKVDEMAEPRWGPTAATLANGRVLVTGGMRGRFMRSKAAEVFDPESGKWTNAGSLNTQRNGHRAILLQDGRVLICGGFSGLEYLRSCEIFVP